MDLGRESVMHEHKSSWKTKLLEYTGFTLHLAGASVISFKYTEWSASLFHWHIEDDPSFFVQLGAVLTGLAWVGSLPVAFFAAFAEWGRQYSQAMEEARERLLEREYDPDDPMSA